MSVLGKHQAAQSLGPSRSIIQGRSDSILLAAAAAIALLHGLFLYSSAGYDDSHITYWAAYALSQFGDIVNYNGDRVEQSSSLLLVILLAAEHLLSGLDMATLGALTSIAAGALTLVLSCHLARRLGVADGWRIALLLALAPQLVFWSFSGMETPLAAACALWFLLAMLAPLQNGLTGARLGHVLLAAGALVAVRPEGFFVAVAFLVALGGSLVVLGERCAAVLPTPRLCAMRLAAIAAAVCVVFLMLTAWRYTHFGSLVPQPVRAKVGHDLADRVADGAGYLLVQIRSVTLVVLLALAATGVVRVLARRSNPKAAFAIFVPGAFVAAQLAFILGSGGDWMNGARFLVPILPLLTIVTLSSLDLMYPGRPRARAVAFAGLVLLAAFDTATFTIRLSTGIPFAIVDAAEPSRDRYLPPDPPAVSWFETNNLIHLRDEWPTLVLEGVVDDLRQSGRRPVSIMSGQMGMIAYHVVRQRFGDVEIIDRRGLATDHFNACARTLDLESFRTGFVVKYEDLFRDRPIIWESCGIDRPDVIFDLVTYGDGTEYYLPITLLEQNGYSLVYAQTGPVEVGWSREYRAEEAIMVRDDLIPLIDPARFRRHDW